VAWRCEIGRWLPVAAAAGAQLVGGCHLIGGYDDFDFASAPPDAPVPHFECGDGIVDPGEQCDDAGPSAACNDDCTEASCGDGKLDEAAGEICDGGDCCDAGCALLGTPEHPVPLDFHGLGVQTATATCSTRAPSDPDACDESRTAASICVDNRAGAGADRVFALHLVEPVLVHVNADKLDHDLDALVRIVPERGSGAGVCADRNPRGIRELLCGDVLDAGDYLVIVDGATAYDCGRFTVTVTVDARPVKNGSFETTDYCGWTLADEPTLPDPTAGTFAVVANGQEIPTLASLFDHADTQQVTQSSPGLPLTAFSSDADFVAMLLQSQKGRGRYALSQEIAVGARTTLAWDMVYRNHQGVFEPGLQELAVNVLDAGGTTLATPFVTTEGVDRRLLGLMTRFTADLAAYAGQTVTIELALEATLGNFDLLVDGIHLE
jgi:hypothetical protein